MGKIMITQRDVMELFSYDQGDLYWSVKLCPKVVVGSKAGNMNANGYRVVQINRRQYYVHRLIYLYFYGYMPKNIDHKHGKRIGNYIWNLRPCTVVQNMSNRCINKNNTSGFRCVVFDKKSGKWHGRVRFKGINYGVGLHCTPEKASEMVEAKRKELHKVFYNVI